VAIVWSRGHWGDAWRGFDGGWFVGQVCRYDNLGGHWRAFLRGHPVNGPFARAVDAQRAASAAYADRERWLNRKQACGWCSQGVAGRSDC
jgi:hypothetical protein